MVARTGVPGGRNVGASCCRLMVVLMSLTSPRWLKRVKRVAPNLPNKKLRILCPTGRGRGASSDKDMASLRSSGLLGDRSDNRVSGSSYPGRFRVHNVPWSTEKQLHDNVVHIHLDYQCYPIVRSVILLPVQARGMLWDSVRFLEDRARTRVVEAGCLYRMCLLEDRCKRESHN